MIVKHIMHLFHLVMYILLSIGSIGIFFLFSVHANDLQIVVDPITKKIYFVTGDASTTPLVQPGSGITQGFNFAEKYIDGGNTDISLKHQENIHTGHIVTGDSTRITSHMHISILTANDELRYALEWMYQQGLTQYNTIESYRPNDKLTREEAAKILGQAYRVFGFAPNTKQNNCIFSDEHLFDPTLRTYIYQSCQWGLFQGYAGTFLPRDFLTKGQAIAVLIRMLEGKKSDENRTPWRELYHKKGLYIGITKDENSEHFGQPITREEIARFVRRTKHIVENEQRKAMSLQLLRHVDRITNEASNLASELNKENRFEQLHAIDISDDPALTEAVAWMHENGFTIHKSVSGFMPLSTVTREQAAKILDLFARKYGSKVTQYFSETDCGFSDITDTPEDLLPHIRSVCQQGLLMGIANFFYPQQPVTKAEFVVALIRLLEGKHLDERHVPWRKKYYESARALDLVTTQDMFTFDVPISRYEVALILYKFHLKYLLLKNANSSQLTNEVISFVSGTMQTGENNTLVAQVFVHVPLLLDPGFTIGYVNSFQQKYKIVRTGRDVISSNTIVWYGDMYDIISNTVVGTIRFVISNGFLVEARMRFSAIKDQDTIIQPIPDNPTVYHIRSIVVDGSS